MSQKLFDISDQGLLTSGVVKSLHPLQVPLWIDGQNVVFEDSAVRKSAGNQRIADPESDKPITGLRDVMLPGAPQLFYGDTESLYRFDGTDITTDGTGYTGILQLSAMQANAFQDDAFQADAQRLATQWSMENWGRWCLASNGLDPIQINKVDGMGFVDLAGSPPDYAQVLVRLKNFVIAFNTDLGGEYFEWCELDDVENWASGAAGNLPIRDLDSEIIAAGRMGDVIGVYSNDNMAVVQWVGATYYFGAKRVLEGIGAVSKLCVVERESQHYGMSKRGFWVTDGTQFKYISPPLLREWLTKNINWDKASKVAGYLNEDRSLIEWGVPTLAGDGNNDLTIGFNFDSGSWTFRSYGITAGLKKGIFDFPIFGLSDGRVLYGEVGLNQDGDPTHAFVQSRPLDLKEILATMSLDYAVAAMKNIVGTDVKVYVGISDSPAEDAAITWSSGETPSLALEPLFVADLEGRFAHFKIESTALDSDWQLAAFQIFGVMTGGLA